jgi:hypothetical protein
MADVDPTRQHDRGLTDAIAGVGSRISMLDHSANGR